MASRISLALVIHNHQPVGNFGWVFADVYEQAYRPMLEAIARHPGIRVGLHYSGPLLEWLRAERPDFIAQLRGLVEREQAEVLGGGLYEPILASLPQRDRIGQLARMAEEVEKTFGRRPAGAWLAERVWEPDLPTSLAGAGYRWTVLDDAHFRTAAIPDDAAWGTYITDDQGEVVTVFGTEQGLRYLIPFRPVEDVVGYLREHATEAGERVGMMGDDGEKFGAWPSMWEHCWGEGRWVEQFFEALDENASWLTTVRPSDWLAANPPVGRAYIPTGSYEEMGEWALPAAESLAFGSVLRRDRDAGAPEVRWLRGASWRNFQVKYREINDLHKQMLRTSAKVAGISQGGPGGVRDAALDDLYRGQSNDCYWHGLFGGIYLAHLRAATLGKLIAAEDAADREAGAFDAAELLDLDLDGHDEVRLSGVGQVVTVDVDEGAGIGAWDLRAVRHAVTGVLRRRPEAYHDLVRQTDSGADAQETAGDGSPASIHHAVRRREPGLAARLVYDGYERRSALVRFVPLDASARDWAAGGGPDRGDFVSGLHRVVRLEPGSVLVERDGLVTSGPAPDGREAGQEVHVEKKVAIAGGRLDPRLRVEMRLENRSVRRLTVRVGLEWATTMLGGGGNPSAWREVAGQRAGHDSSGDAAGIRRLGEGNDWLGVAIESSVEPAADAWWAPIETVSNSEAGFERVYQGSALLLSWPIDLAPGKSWSATVEQRVTIDRDRAAGQDLGQNVPSARGLRATG
jgi:hypothetical protein